MDKRFTTEEVFKVRRMTGKKLRTCYFCLRYHRGNFKKAVEMCSDEPEGGRRQAA
jgi:hypothetical protein